MTSDYIGMSDPTQAAYISENERLEARIKELEDENAKLIEDNMLRVMGKRLMELEAEQVARIKELEDELDTYQRWAVERIKELEAERDTWKRIAEHEKSMRFGIARTNADLLAALREIAHPTMDAHELGHLSDMHQEDIAIARAAIASATDVSGENSPAADSMAASPDTSATQGEACPECGGSKYVDVEPPGTGLVKCPRCKGTGAATQGEET